MQGCDLRVIDHCHSAASVLHYFVAYHFLYLTSDEVKHLDNPRLRPFMIEQFMKMCASDVESGYRSPVITFPV